MLLIQHVLKCFAESRLKFSAGGRQEFMWFVGNSCTKSVSPGQVCKSCAKLKVA